MRKLIIATAALAFLSSTAFAQDKAAAPAAKSGDTMSKGDMSKDKMSKTKMTKKSKKSTSKMSSEPKK
jgi:pentapeptide MXKDX repeat protein